MRSCVNDDSFFPEETKADILFSPAVVSILSNLDAGNTLSGETNQCFKFIYPITLGYNTDSSIRIDSYEGLRDVISSQQANFNITGVLFPVQIVFKESDEVLTLANEEELLRIVNECEFDTIRNEFDRFFEKCFKFDYPVTLRSADGRELSIRSDDEFQIFYQNQGNEYQPDFVFPIRLLIEPNLEPASIATYFEFYRTLDSCGRLCPQLDFAVELTNAFTLEYMFKADFPAIDSLSLYSWFIDGEFIENDGVDNQGDNLLVHSFDTPGSYEVCILTETSSCPQGIQFCKTIEVGGLCPDLFFEFEQEPGTLQYIFTATFDGIADVSYKWFIDNEQVEVDGGADGDNELLSTLLLGEHVICIKTVTPSCPDGKEFCKEIIVEPICPDLFFEVEQEPGVGTYNFIASFNEIQETTYEWVIDGDAIEVDGGDEGDNMLFFQFDAGQHEICIRTETGMCPNGIEFCKQIIVD